MQKILLVLAAVLFGTVAMPQATIAANTQSPEEVLVKKKKAAEAKRIEEKKKKAAAERKRAAEKKMAARKAEKKREARRRDCGAFLECLFGKPRRGLTRQASLSSGTRGAVDRVTAEEVSWSEASKYAVGSIIVKTPERALYLVTGTGRALRYKVGVGREGFQWSGSSRIVSKQEWPTWRPPEAMIKREAAKGHILPAVMEGGPENPLGARALYIGGTLYRIHGTNNAASIGGAVSSGCIRMMNSDVVDLYERVNVGARVYVYQ